MKQRIFSFMHYHSYFWQDKTELLADKLALKAHFSLRDRQWIVSPYRKEHYIIQKQVDLKQFHLKAKQKNRMIFVKAESN